MKGTKFLTLFNLDMREEILSWVILQFLTLKCYGKSEFRYVTYGSIVKLYNEEHQACLHSHKVKYGSGGGQSGQQSVTGVSSPNEDNSYWLIKGKHGTHCKRGNIVKCGDNIRLQHLNTKRNLHSHKFLSPLTHQQEVSVFDESGDGGTGDNWEVKCIYKYWSRKDKIRFQHVDTSLYLHMSLEQFEEDLPGQHEICGSHYQQYSNLWVAQEGVYMRENKENVTHNAYLYELGCTAFHCNVIFS